MCVYMMYNVLQSVGAGSAVQCSVDVSEGCVSTVHVWRVLGSYLALAAAAASEADFLFLPESPPGHDWPERVCAKLQQVTSSDGTTN